MQTARSAALVVMSGALCACGGGGGGSSGPSVPTTPLAITAANAQDIASGVANTGLGTAGAGTFFEIASKTTGPVAQRTTGLTTIMRQVAQAMLTPRAPSPCNVSGTFEVTSSGQGQETVTFNNCSDFAGESLNGSVSISNGVVNPGVSFSGTASMGVTLKLTGLPDFTVSGSGINVSETVSAGVDTVTMSGSSILATVGTVASQLSNYNIVAVFNNNTSVETDTVTLDFASTKIGGQVHVSTGTPPVTNFADDSAHSGVLNVTGTGGSKLQITINGNEASASPQVTLGVDADGNGSFETTLPKNWSDLNA